MADPSVPPSPSEAETVEDETIATLRAEVLRLTEAFENAVRERDSWRQAKDSLVVRLNRQDKSIASYQETEAEQLANTVEAVNDAKELRAENLRLREALQRIRRAWYVTGPRPDLHDAAIRKLRSEWPTLHDTIVAALGSVSSEPPRPTFVGSDGNEWSEVVLPFLDAHNDHITLYARRDGDLIVLLDEDGCCDLIDGGRASSEPPEEP